MQYYRKLTVTEANIYFIAGAIRIGEKLVLLNGKSTFDMAFELNTGHVIVSSERLPINPNYVKLIEVTRDKVSGRLLIDLEQKADTVYSAWFIMQVLAFLDLVTTKIRGFACHSVQDVIAGKIRWTKIVSGLNNGELVFRNYGQLSLRPSIGGNFAIIVESKLAVVDGGIIYDYFNEPTKAKLTQMLEGADTIGVNYILTRTDDLFAAIAVDGQKTVVIDMNLVRQTYDTPNFAPWAAADEMGETVSGLFHTFQIGPDGQDVINFDIEAKSLVKQLPAFGNYLTLATDIAPLES